MPQHSIHPVGYPIYCVSFTPKKPRLLVAGGGGQGTKSGVKNAISVYDVDEKTLQVQMLTRFELGKNDDAPMAMAVHPTDKLVAAGINSSENSQSLRLFKFITPGGLAQFRAYSHNPEPKPEDYIKSLRWSQKGDWLLSAGSDGRVTCYQYSTPHLKETNTVVTHGGNEVLDADFSADSSMMASISVSKLYVTAPGSAKLFFSLAEVKYKRTTSCTYKSIRFAPSPASSSTSSTNHAQEYLYAILNTNDRKKSLLVRFTVGKWETRKTVFLANKAVTTMEISTCGKYLAYATSDFGIGIVDTRTLKTIKFIPRAHTFAITSLSFSPSYPLLLSGSADGHFGVWGLPPLGRSSPVFLVTFLTILVLLIAYLLLFYVDQKVFEETLEDVVRNWVPVVRASIDSVVIKAQDVVKAAGVDKVWEGIW